MSRARVAFVVQRCGREVNGGAEYLCLDVARRMAQRWDLEILTTCALDYVTWANHYAPGVEQIDGVTVRRFPVEKPRKAAHFDRLSRALIERLPDVSLEEQVAWMRAQGPLATGLFDHLREAGPSYDAVFFFGYLYATTYFGLPLVSERAVLVPFAHDEWPMRFPMWNEFFAQPRTFVFSTPEERTFVEQRFPELEIAGPVVGIGVEAPADADPRRFRERYDVAGPYALFLGRIDASKGCDALLEYHAFARSADAQTPLLVLAGRDVMHVPAREDVRTTGFIDERTKWDALAGAVAVVMPSHLESLSIVLLEGWSVGRPALVSAASPVLVGQCRRANGGLWFGDGAEYAAALHLLSATVGAQLGDAGRRYVGERYTWPAVVAAYEAVLAGVRAV